MTAVVLVLVIAASAVTARACRPAHRVIDEAAQLQRARAVTPDTWERQ